MDALRFFASSIYAPHLLALIIGIPSVLLYTMELYLVLKNRQKFNGSFFQLFAIRAITNIYNLFISYLAPRFPLLGLFFGFYNLLPTKCLNFFLFSSFYTFHVENLSTIAMALNRLTAILYALSYDNIWKKLLPICIGVIFTVPLVLNFPLFLLNMDLYFHDPTKNTSFGFMNLDAYQYFPHSDLNAYTTIGFAGICGCLNIWSWVAFRRHAAKFTENAQNNSSVAMEHNRMEARLFTFSFCTFICQFVMASFYYGIYLATRNGRTHFWAELLSNALWYNYGLINDTFTVVIPAWLMLWSSTMLCQMVVEMFVGFKRNLVSTTIVRAIVKMSKSNNNNVQVVPYI